MSINVVFYGYEPEVFKTAFRHKWLRREQIGLFSNVDTTEGIQEEDEEDDDDQEQNK